MTGLEVELFPPGRGMGRAPPGREVDTSIEWGCGAGDRRRRRPTIDEGAVAEFALAIGHSTGSGRRYLGTRSARAPAPADLGAVLAGEVAVWKARRIAQGHYVPPARRCGGRRSGSLAFARCSLRRSTGGSKALQGARPGRDRTPTAEAAEKRREGPPGAMTYDGWSRSPRWPTCLTRSRSRTTSGRPAARMDPAIPFCRSVGPWCWACSAAGTAMRR